MADRALEQSREVKRAQARGLGQIFDLNRIGKIPLDEAQNLLELVVRQARQAARLPAQLAIGVRQMQSDHARPAFKVDGARDPTEAKFHAKGIADLAQDRIDADVLLDDLRCLATQRTAHRVSIEVRIQRDHQHL